MLCIKRAPPLFWQMSRAPLPQMMTPKQPSLEIFCLETEKNDHQVNTQITSNTMATKADPVMNSLERTIVNGWPLEKRCLPSCLTPYWNIRDEMSVGVMYRGAQAIIPSSMQKEMLKKNPFFTSRGSKFHSVMQGYRVLAWNASSY